MDIKTILLKMEASLQDTLQEATAKVANAMTKETKVMTKEVQVSPPSLHFMDTIYSAILDAFLTLSSATYATITIYDTKQKVVKLAFSYDKKDTMAVNHSIIRKETKKSEKDFINSITVKDKEISKEALNPSTKLFNSSYTSTDLSSSTLSIGDIEELTLSTYKTEEATLKPNYLCTPIVYGEKNKSILAVVILQNKERRAESKEQKEERGEQGIKENSSSIQNSTSVSIEKARKKCETICDSQGHINRLWKSDGEEALTFSTQDLKVISVAARRAASYLYTARTILFTSDSPFLTPYLAASKKVNISYGNYLLNTLSNSSVKIVNMDLNDKFNMVISRSSSIDSLILLIAQAASNNYPVLVTGEEGSGKTFFSYQIHKKSLRASKPFIVLDCAKESYKESADYQSLDKVKGLKAKRRIQARDARYKVFIDEEKSKEPLNSSNIDKSGSLDNTVDNINKTNSKDFSPTFSSLLLGYEKEGVHYQSLLDLAEGGTLLLKDVSFIPLSLQKELLYLILSNKKDVRIMATSSLNLVKKVEKGEFLEKLFFLLNTTPIRIPPLRARKEDIIPLARLYLKECSLALNKECLDFSPAAITELKEYEWKYNARELKSIIYIACSTCIAKIIQTDDLKLVRVQDLFEELALTIVKQAKDKTLKTALDRFKRAYIIKTLQSVLWNQTAASKVLSIQRTYLARLITELHIRDASDIKQDKPNKE